MRNLKKILALALALVMTLSVMSVASAKTLGEYADASSVSAKHAVAVDVATQLGILEGVTATNYAPQGTLTRAQLATMIYRITTGDVKGTYVSNFAAGAAAKFSDVKADAWYAGYVGYCADAGYLQGVGDGKYAPNSKLTGYQALAALLRAIGYNQPGEFTGADWTVRVAQIATQAKVSVGVVTDLNKAITREQAAQFIYNALFTQQVEYTPAFGYTALSSYFGNKYDLAWDVFSVWSDKAGEAGQTIDDWGRPGTVWYLRNADGEKTAKAAVVIAEKKLAEHHVAVSDCQLALDLGLKEDATVALYDNGVKAVSGTAIDVDRMVLDNGAQGTLIEVYGDRLVKIDTYLAAVGIPHAAKYDVNGHLVTSAYTDISVYKTGATPVSAYLAGVAHTYGEMILVNYNAAKNYYVSLGAAQTLVGAQTVIWQNAAKHTVAGNTYMDAVHFYLDAAGNTASAQFTWFFDQYGNLIGNASIATVYSYATIKDIQWFNPQSAFGYAQATLVYVDGTTETVIVKSIDNVTLKYSMFEGNPSKGGVSANYGYNAAYIGEKLYALTKDASGVATLTTVNTVVTGATVTTKNPVITDGKSAYTYVDDSTQFLVRTGPVAYAYAWSTVAGYNLMPTLQNATVYYVNLDADLAAEYAYVYGATSNALTPNLVYVNSLAYAYDTFDAAGDPETVVLKDAYVGGVLTDVVVKYTCVNGTSDDLVAGHLYYMVDEDANGYYRVGESTDLIGADNVAVGALTAKYVAAGDYTVLNNALQVKDINVPFNITGIVPFGGTWTGAENIVVIYSGYTVAAIYVVAAAPAV